MGAGMIAGAGLGTIGAIGGMINSFSTAHKLGQLAGAINPVDPTYSVSEYAKQRMGLATSLLNARMPGASTIDRGIQTNQATQINSVNRDATDSSTALATLGQVQGQTNRAESNLGVQEQQDYYNRLGNENNALQGMVGEGDKVYQDQLRDYQEKLSLKNAYMGAQMQDKAQAWSSLASTGVGAMGVASQMGGGGGSSFSPAPATYNPGLANTAGAYSSPAANIGYINPQSAQNLLPT